MKPEKEFQWLILLIRSNFVKGWFRSKSGTKKDFERVVKAPQNSNEFYRWFNELVKDGCINNDGKIPHPTNTKWMVNGYVGNKKKLEERLKNLNCYTLVHKYFEKKFLG